MLASPTAVWSRAADLLQQHIAVSWPSVSLTSLNRSRSISRTATGSSGCASSVISAIGLEAPAVRQPRQRIVTRRVLAAHTLLAGAVESKQREGEQRDDQQRVLLGRDDHRRQAQQHAVGHRREAPVVHEVLPQRDVLREGDGRADDREVDDEEHGRAEQHDRQLRVAERPGLVDVRHAGDRVHDQPAAAQRQADLACVERGAVPGLASVCVLEERSQRLRDQAGATATDQDQCESERRRDRQPLVVAAPRDLQRQHLREDHHPR